MNMHSSHQFGACRASHRQAFSCSVDMAADEYAAVAAEFKVMSCFGGHGNQPGRFNEPRGVALCETVHGERLIVSETRRLQVLTLDGCPQQVLPPGPSQSLRSAPLPPGLWGICATYDRVYVVNVISNELHVLSLRCRTTHEAYE